LLLLTNVELLGSYNPHSNNIQIDGDRVKHWMSVGAQVSDTMHNLLIREKKPNKEGGGRG